MSEEINIQPAIELFAQRARQFEEPLSAREFEQAVALLGQWITREHRWLTKDDIAMLGDIGAVLFRASASA